MPTNYPTSLDDSTSLPNPAGSDDLANVTAALAHATQHDTVNDAIKALEAKVGIDNSAVSTSLDYKSRKGSFIRAPLTVSSSSLGTYSGDSTKDVAAGHQGICITIATDYPAWIIAYSTDAARTADTTRATGQNLTSTPFPVLGTGVLFEVVTTGGGAVVHVGLPIYNSETVFADKLYLRIINQDTVTRVIAVTIKWVPSEG